MAVGNRIRVRRAPREESRRVWEREIGDVVIVPGAHRPNATLACYIAEVIARTPPAADGAGNTYHVRFLLDGLLLSTPLRPEDLVEADYRALVLAYAGVCEAMNTLEHAVQAAMESKDHPPPVLKTKQPASEKDENDWRYNAEDVGDDDDDDM